MAIQNKTSSSHVEIGTRAGGEKENISRLRLNNLANNLHFLFRAADTTELISASIEAQCRFVESGESQLLSPYGLHSMSNLSTKGRLSRGQDEP